MASAAQAKEFIQKIAPLIQTEALARGYKVCSPIIAQACIESAYDGSLLAYKYHNYFGMKCGSSWKGRSVNLRTKEEVNSQLVGIRDNFRVYSTMEQGVTGYFEFISTKRYANLKDADIPEEYLKRIKADGYATSLKYVSNLMAVIEKYNLTQYDNQEEMTEVKKMKINVHAGHNPDGKAACGAIGFIKESTENRNVKNEVIRLLKALGHTVYDCTCENGTSKEDVLKKIVSKCNAHEVDLDVSIHFNAGAGDSTGNGKTTGTEVYIYSDASKAKPYAQKVASSISSLGFKLRDDAVKDNVKNASYLYVLKNTKSPAMLIECCFVDDKDDVALYDYKSMAEAIVYGITGQKHQEAVEDKAEESKVLYRVQVGAYGVKANAEAMQKKLKAAGFDAIIVKA